MNLVALERKRLARQCQTILARLQQGTVTNRELAGIALNHTARISELRGAGYNVQVISRDRATGLATYALLPPAEPTQADLFEVRA